MLDERGDFDIIDPVPEDRRRAVELADRLATAPVGYVDAMVIAIAERLRVPHIATIDYKMVGMMNPVCLPPDRRGGPAILVRTEFGIEHVLTARRLYVVGAQLLWEVSTEDDVDEEVRHTARDLIVLRDGQYVFRQVIEQYLRQITYDDEYARRLELPRYEVAHIVTDPEVNFGKPYFAHSGTPLAVVRDLLRAGETVADVAGDFGIPIDEVTEFAQRERLLAA